MRSGAIARKLVVQPPADGRPVVRKIASLRVPDLHAAPRSTRERAPSGQGMDMPGRAPHMSQPRIRDARRERNRGPGPPHGADGPHAARTETFPSSRYHASDSSPVKIFGQHDEQTIKQLQAVRSRARDAALMADGHVGYVMPIGGVAAYRDQGSVVGVGFDIACGNAAIRTDLKLGNLGRTPDEVQGTLVSLADDIA